MREADLTRLRRTSLRSRDSKVSFRGFAKPVRRGMTVRAFLDALPDYLSARDLREVARAIVRARKRGAPVILGAGAHFVKVGLSDLLARAMAEGRVTHVAMNGAGAIHDVELALAGKTSEDVESALAAGTFGMARETAQFLHAAVAEGARDGLGYGQAVGRAIAASGARYRDRSLLGQAWRRKVPLTVHVCLGADIVHMHPEADGAATGLASLRDFRILCDAVCRMEGGVYLNVGSAVVLPEVFLKAVAVARNLGHPLRRITTANLDFLKHYRPDVNVVRRPTAAGGRGYHLIGPHEILFPLLLAAVAEEAG